MRRRTRLVTLLLAGAMLAAGCGSAARQSSGPSGPVQPPSLSTSLVTTTGTWAVAVMGGSAADHNNQVSGARLLVDPVPWNYTDTATENQWIAQVPIVEHDRTVDRGDTHPVTVIAHARHYALENAPRMQDAPG